MFSVILKQQETIECSFTQTVSLGFTHPALLGLELKLRLNFELISLSLSIPVIHNSLLSHSHYNM